MIQIVPAILSTTEEDFKRDFEKITTSPSFQEGKLHIDFMDNQFVPNKSIDAGVTKKYPIPLDKQAHLMVNHPLEWLEPLKDAGFSAVLFHAEAKDDIAETIKKARELELKVGIVLNHETPITDFEQYFSQLDEVLIMAIVPGFQSQPFIEASLEKISRLAELKNEKGYTFSISVDGHVNDETAKKIINAGADILIVGSFILKGDPDEQLEKLWEILR